MFHKVKTVAPLKDFNLSVVFLTEPERIMM